MTLNLAERTDPAAQPDDDALRGFALTPQLVAVADLAPDPANPRSAIADDGIAELADSIFASGLLQPVIARINTRPDDTSGKPLLLIAGHRRLAACNRLIDTGRWPAEAQIPVMLTRDIDGTRALLAAVVENVQREDLAPLDEARAICALEDAGHSIPAIAAALGKSRRHVELRRRLVRDLVPEAQAKLAAREITLAQARVLATVKPKQQAEALEDLADDPHQDAEQLRTWLDVEWFDAAEAHFDPAAYDGEIVEEPETGKRFYTDVAQARRLQKEAMIKLADELAGQRAWVETFGLRKGDQPGNAYSASAYDEPDDDTPNSEVGAVIVHGREWRGDVIIERAIRSRWHPLDIKDSQVPSKATTKGKAKAPPPAKPPIETLTEAARTHANRRRTRALQCGILAAGTDHAMRIVALALLANTRVLGLCAGTSAVWREQPAIVADEVMAELAPFRQKLAAAGRFEAKAEADPASGCAITDSKGPLRLTDRRGYGVLDQEELAPAWAALLALSGAEVARLVQALVAAGVQLRRDDVGVDPLEAALAATFVGEGERTIVGGERWLEPADLDGLGKPALAAIAAELGKDPGATAKVTRERILAADGAKHYTAPHLAFAPTKAIAKRFDQALKAAAKAGGTPPAAEKAPAAKPKKPAKRAAKSGR